MNTKNRHSITIHALAGLIVLALWVLPMGQVFSTSAQAEEQKKEEKVKPKPTPPHLVKPAPPHAVKPAPPKRMQGQQPAPPHVIKPAPPHRREGGPESPHVVRDEGYERAEAMKPANMGQANERYMRLHEFYQRLRVENEKQRQMIIELRKRLSEAERR